MDDLISRQAALNCFHAWIDKHGDVHEPDEIPEYEMIEALPPIQPMRKKGKWVSDDAVFCGIPYHCDQCGERTLNTIMGKPRWNFCPMCGADMGGKADGQT